MNLANNPFLKKYLCELNIAHHKYLAVEYKNEIQSSGFIDTLNQFNAYLKLSHIFGLKLVKFNKPLAPKHNAGRDSNFLLSDYFDINSITINGEKVSIMEDTSSLNSQEILTVEGLKYDTKQSEPKNSLNLMDFQKILDTSMLMVKHKPHKKYINFANNFIKTNNLEGCIHIRRGDRLEVGAPARGISPEEWDFSTRTKNILHFLDSKSAPQSIYVMTDMKPDDKIISELKESNKYNFSFLHDNEELISLKEKDNYAVFHQEQCIQDSNLIKFKSNRFDLIYFYKEQHDLPQT